MSKFALRFISGKYKGGEYVLTEDKEFYIGRSSGIDLVLMEDMVSRKHARLILKNNQIHIEDLGSTNGTFVNGEKIAKAVVGKGDRILIGTSIMKVVDASDAPAYRDVGAGVSTDRTATGRATQHGSRSMAGTVAEVPLPDLIQLFSTSKKTGTLVIQKERITAKIHLEKGAIIFGSLSDHPDLAPLKALFRILAWEDGNFELVGPESKQFPEKLDLPTEHILMEGLRQLDELRHLERKLPKAGTELVVVTPLMTRLADLNENELDVFQLIYNHGEIKMVLDRSRISDLNAATILVDLIKRKYVATV